MMNPKQNRNSESAAGSTRLLHRLTAALLALVLAVSIALPVFAADEAQTDTVYINSVQDLLAFADKCGFDQWSKGKTVILQEDLSLEDTEWAPVASFSGAFKGNGHNQCWYLHSHLLCFVPLIGMMLGKIIGSITTFFAYKYDLVQNISSWLEREF